jgi:hypothetical protein
MGGLVITCFFIAWLVVGAVVGGLWCRLDKVNANKEDFVFMSFVWPLFFVMISITLLYKFAGLISGGRFE